jgi:hypothetical protein
MQQATSDGENSISMYQPAGVPFHAELAPRGRFGEFRSENRSIGCRWGSGRLTVVVGLRDPERRQKSNAVL